MKHKLPWAINKENLKFYIKPSKDIIISDHNIHLKTHTVNMN